MNPLQSRYKFSCGIGHEIITHALYSIADTMGDWECFALPKPSNSLVTIALSLSTP